MPAAPDLAGGWFEDGELARILEFFESGKRFFEIAVAEFADVLAVQ
jgi:hypothetical protein